MHGTPSGRTAPSGSAALKNACFATPLPTFPASDSKTIFMQSIPRFSRTLSLLAGTTLAGSLAAAPYADLPQMGNPVDRTLAPQAEAELGQQYMRELRHQAPFIDDPLLISYLQALSQRLAAGLENPDLRIHVSLIDNPAINAFAAPGGYISFFSGLVAAARTEAELAGVLAHEMAHVSQRHIAESLQNAGNERLTLLASMLAAIILSSTSADASQAALYAGMAGATQQQLNYTRQHEYEADRIGIHLLEVAGYDPHGMVDFFALLQRREGYSDNRQLEYLRTHPLSANRLAEARTLADHHSDASRHDSPDFQFARLRLLGITGPVDQLAREAQRPDLSPAQRGYAQALRDSGLGRDQQAQERLQALGDEYTDNIWLAIALAETALRTGSTKTVSARIDGLLELFPDHHPLLLTAARLHRRENAERAHELLLTAIKTRPSSQQAFQQLAQLASEQGWKARQHEAEGMLFLLQGNLHESLDSLEHALALEGIDEISRLKLAALRDKIRQEIRRDSDARHQSNQMAR